MQLQDLTLREWPDFITPSTASVTSSERDCVVMSNDPLFACLPNTPRPEICEFCGAERYTEGLMIFGRQALWNPGGANSCVCVDGIAAYALRMSEIEVREEAERKEKAAAQARERVRRIIGESGMGERFLRRTFQSFIADTPELKRILSAAQTYAVAFDGKLPKRGESLPGRNGFIISGTKGTGKTHIVSAIANELMRRGVSVICMGERGLFERIRRTYSEHGTSEGEVLGMYERIPLLIIDDLGKEKATDWTLSTLYAIVDGRYERAMPTIVTTNYDAKSLVERLTPAKADKTTADAIVDRLMEMCECVVMRGDSWRSR